MREAESRLKLAEQRHRGAEEREAAASELEGALRADRRELSLRESAVSAAEARAASRERAARHLEECLKVELAAAAAKQGSAGKPLSSANTAAPSTAADGGAASRRTQEWAIGGAQFHFPAVRTGILEATSPSPSLGWDSLDAQVQGRHAMRVEGVGAGAGTVGQVMPGERERNVEERERHLAEWSKALAEQAEAMGEQAVKLEAAYDQLRQREEAGDAATADDAPAVVVESQEGASAGKAKEGCGSGVQQGEDDGIREVDERPRQTEDRQVTSSSRTHEAPATSEAEAPIDRSVPVRATETASEQALDRHLEQETVRLAEKARELEAERRRLTAASEAANHEHDRAQIEKQEASEARKSAAALRLQLEREKAKLEAERGGLAAEKSLLAAERDRLETEKARALRETCASNETLRTINANESGRKSTPAFGLPAAVAAERRDHAATAVAPSPVPLPSVAGSHDVRDAGTSPRDAGAASGTASQVEMSDIFSAQSTSEVVDPLRARNDKNGDSNDETKMAEERPRTGLGLDKRQSIKAENMETGRPVPHTNAGSKISSGDSVKALVQEMAAELGQQSAPRRNRASHNRSTEPASNNATAASVDGVNRVSSSRSASPRASGARRRQHQRNASEAQGDKTRANSRRNTRRGGQGGRRWGSENTRGTAEGVGPSLDSIRRRLHGAATAARGTAQEAVSDTSGDDVEFSSPVATPVSRPTPARSTSSSPRGARVVGGQYRRSLVPPPRTSEVPSGDKEQHQVRYRRREEEEQKSPRAGIAMVPLLRPGVTVASTVSKTGAAAVHEDPFLAQLHARLAGADHTLRESLGRRQALINKFGYSGGSGGLSSSLGPSEGEETTSDFPSGSPELTTSNGSSPADAAVARGTTTSGVERQARRGPGAAESSPESPGIRGRFGFTGRGTPRRVVVTPQGPGRRSSLLPVASGEPEQNSRPTERKGQAASASSTATFSAPRAGQAFTGIGRSDDTRVVSMTAASVPAVGAQSPPPAAQRDTRDAMGSSTVVMAGPTRRVTSAASDTDDTEAEKENLRELMMALGADGGEDDIDNDDNDDGHDRATGHSPGSPSDRHANAVEHVDQGRAQVSPAEGVAPAVASSPAAADLQYAGLLEWASNRRPSHGERSHTAMATSDDIRSGGSERLDAFAGNGEESTGVAAEGDEHGVVGSERAPGEADAGGGDTLMSSLRAQHEDIASRLQDISLQVPRQTRSLIDVFCRFDYTL